MAAPGCQKQVAHLRFDQLRAVVHAKILHVSVDGPQGTGGNDDLAEGLRHGPGLLARQDFRDAVVGAVIHKVEAAGGTTGGRRERAREVGEEAL